MMDDVRPNRPTNTDFRNRMRSYEQLTPGRRYATMQATPAPRPVVSRPLNPARTAMMDGMVSSAPLRSVFAEPTPQPTPQAPQMSYQAAAPIAQVNHQRRTPQVSYRQVTARPSRPSLLWKFQTQLLPHLLTGMAAIIFVAGMGVTANSWYNNRKVAAQVSQIAQNQSTDEADSEIQTGNIPDESAPHPKAYANHTAAPDAPRYIRIKELKVDARVIELDLKKDGQLQTPASIYTTGWYRGSAKPGQPGAMLVDAHVGGPTKPGVFSKLNKLQPGSLIEVEQGDGKKLKYKVVKSKQYPADKVDMAAASVPVEPGKPGLNLITCAGTLNAKEFSYNERLVVFATMVK